jgi:vitamin B12/bleomycin/antimicrobial peptide transport system ATP-binding/permease protein
MWRHFWRIAGPYWSSEERWAARGLLAIIIVINLALVWVNVELNAWNNEFYNALQDKKFERFKALVWQFTGWAFLSIVLSVYQLYLTQMLQMRWRLWLTHRWVDRWAANKSYYRIAMFDSTVDNPDQRLTEDIKEFVNDTLSLFIGLLSSTVSLISFVGILWTLSGAIKLLGVSVPGYMVWVALAYAFIGSYCVHRVARPLVKLNVDQQRHEADFRYSLVRVRDNAEAIALYKAEAPETSNMRERFSRVAANWWQLMKHQKRYMWFATFYGQAAIIFPMLVGAPRYFSGAIQLGGLMQISSAFGQVQSALSWFIDAYVRLAAWRSQIMRLIGFDEAMTKVEQSGSGAPTAPSTTTIPSIPALTMQNLKVNLPSGETLISIHGVSINQGQHTVVNGASGSGKSTLFRAMAGLWPYVQGSIDCGTASDSLYLPQRTYLPLGTLRACICFPRTSDKFKDDEIQSVMGMLGLEHLWQQIDETAVWHATLSPGEQQRLAIARALLVKPTWLFLDEATSALGEEVEAQIYGLLGQQLKTTTYITIAHRDSVDKFHRQRLRITMERELVAEVIVSKG